MVSERLMSISQDERERSMRLMHELCKCPHWCQNSTRLHSSVISLRSSFAAAESLNPIWYPNLAIAEDRGILIGTERGKAIDKKSQP